jgi:tRNA-binding protein
MHPTHDLNAPAGPLISFDAFLAVDIRIGTIVTAESFPESRKPALKLGIDFGPVIGSKKSNAQIIPAAEFSDS